MLSPSCPQTVLQSVIEFLLSNPTPQTYWTISKATGIKDYDLLDDAVSKLARVRLVRIASRVSRNLYVVTQTGITGLTMDQVMETLGGGSKLTQGVGQKETTGGGSILGRQSEVCLLYNKTTTPYVTRRGAIIPGLSIRPNPNRAGGAQ